MHFAGVIVNFNVFGENAFRHVRHAVEGPLDFFFLAENAGEAFIPHSSASTEIPKIFFFLNIKSLFFLRIIIS